MRTAIATVVVVISAVSASAQPADPITAPPPAITVTVTGCVVGGQARQDRRRGRGGAVAVAGRGCESGEPERHHGAAGAPGRKRRGRSGPLPEAVIFRRRQADLRYYAAGAVAMRICLAFVLA